MAPEAGTVEAAGLLAAAGSVGPSFQPGLLPRTTRDQALITGVVASANYAFAATTQALAEAVGRGLLPRRDTVRRRGARAVLTDPRTAALVTQLCACGAGIALQRLAVQHPGERLGRAAVRVFGWRLTAGGVAGALATAADAVADRLTGARTAARVNVAATLLAGAGVSAVLYARQRRGADVPAGTQAIRAAGVGTLVSASILAAARAESAAAAALGRAVTVAVPSLAPAERLAGHALTLSLLCYAGRRAALAAYRRIDSAGVVVEPAHQERPTSPLVSGGPGSLVQWADFGREGRRYVGMTLSARDIAHVTGAQDSRDPIRVFVGLASALTPGERADLAMRELERTGAFERRVLAYFSPTGSGYVNYVAAETLEYLTGGDVASIAIAYSVRPSFLSLDRVRAAWEENLAFLTALSWRLRAIDPDRRPRLVLFGESLGSQAAQNVFLHQGTRGLALLGIDRALFVGTPFASAWRRAWLDDPAACDGDGRVVEVASYEEWLALPAERRAAARVVLLTHHEDPVPKLGLPLLIQAPDWLGPVRGPGIPQAARWRPFVTALITFVDMLNAIHVVPGQFVSLGHDYRGDLARFVRLAFDLPADAATMAAVERALRERELHWAHRRVAGGPKDVTLPA
ncbi:alpha/beta-hydrolase family protein [Nonomuraea gerenzanensis]|nr:alpha/beta-hydrolase family protein [Nonomuraea gerenzanensis]UBU16935.1 alpha/beta hydrolase [Nonomuraea gerenzanensis]